MISRRIPFVTGVKGTILSPQCINQVCQFSCYGASHYACFGQDGFRLLFWYKNGNLAVAGVRLQRSDRKIIKEAEKSISGMFRQGKWGLGDYGPTLRFRTRQCYD